MNLSCSAVTAAVVRCNLLYYGKPLPKRPDLAGEVKHGTDDLAQRKPQRYQPTPINLVYQRLSGLFNLEVAPEARLANEIPLIHCVIV